MSQNYVITITACSPNIADPTDSGLTLSDNGQTDADPGDQITWKIGSKSGVGRISAITKDKDSIDVFGPPESNEPKKQSTNNSANWKGTINSNIARGSIEDYTIVWYTDASPEAGPYSTDPKIKINPETR